MTTRALSRPAARSGQPARRRASGRGADVRRDVVTLVAFAVGLVVVLAALGWLLVHVLAHGGVGSTDRGVDQWLADHRSGAGNAVSDVVTYFAETPVVIGIALLLIVCSRRFSHGWSHAIYVFAVVVGEVTIFVLVTMLVHRARPDVRLDHAPPTSSFPSGHTAASVALYGSMAVLAWHHIKSSAGRWTLAVAAVVIPLGVAASRLYRGMHFPTDVAAGLLLGATWLVVVTRTLRPGDS